MADLKTIWSNENFDGAIKSNVDFQDDMQLDDMADVGISNIGKATVGSLKNVVYSNGITKGVAQALTKEKSPEVPRGTLRDNKFDEWLVKAKSKNYKNVKLSSKIGTFAGISDLINTSCGLMVGAMGKSATASFIDDMAVKFAGGIDNKAVQFTAGLGVAGILEKLGNGMAEKLPTAEELTALTLANYYNIYENKPGRYVRDRYGKYNYVTGNYDDSLSGEKTSSDADGKIASAVKKITETGEKVSTAMRKINQYGLNMKGVTDFVAKKTKVKESSTEDYENAAKASLIISSQRKDFEGNIGAGTAREKMFDLKGNEVKKTNIDAVKSLMDWVDDRQGLAGERIKNAEIYERVNGNFKNIGCLYIEPYYAPENSLQCFEIPFEFNPKISGDSYEAKYNTEELMGRLLSIRSYVGSDAGTLSIEAEYLALSKNGDANLEPWLNGWMTDWTVIKLEEIEMKYRSLVFPYIDAKESVFVKPPIVRIKLGAKNTNDTIKDGNKTIDFVGDLFKYPIVEGDTDCIQVTKSLEDFTREKRYIVTNVEISPLNENWGNNFYVYKSDKPEEQGYRRNGFKVNLSLVETTKNFLDIVPNFKQYYTYATNEIASKTTGLNDDTLKSQGANTENSLNLESYDKIKDYKVSVTIKNGEDGTIFDDSINRTKDETNFFVKMYKFDEEIKKDFYKE